MLEMPSFNQVPSVSSWFDELEILCGFCGYKMIWHTPQAILSNNVPAGIWLPKVNNRNPRAKCVIFSRLTIKTPERRHCVFIVNFEHISHRSSVFIISFEHVIVGWCKALQLWFQMFEFVNFCKCFQNFPKWT